MALPEFSNSCNCSHEYQFAGTQSSQFCSQHKACEAFCGDYVLDTFFFWVLKQGLNTSD